MIPPTTLQIAHDLIALQGRAAEESAALTAASEACEGAEAVGIAALAKEMEQVGKVLTNYIPRLMQHIGEIQQEAGMQVGHMDEPEDVAIPPFLTPDPMDAVPDALRLLAEPGESTQAMQARLWSLYLELNGKLMLNLASPEEIALHTKLHNDLHWIAPTIEGEA
jgi:hypothetical protein